MQSLVADPETFGQQFEPSVFRDLSVYAQTPDACLFAHQGRHTAESFDPLVR